MAYEMRISDWSSDVCSSDLPARCSCPGCPVLSVFMAPFSAVLGDLETDRPSGFKKNRLSGFVNVLLSGDANPNRVRAHDPGSRHDRRDRRRPEALLRPRRDEGTAPGRRGGGDRKSVV